MKTFTFFLFLVLTVQFSFAQKKYINRKVAQKNYEGYMLMKEHKYDSALILFNQAIKADNEAYFIYQNRALCNLKLKDTVAAIRDFKSNLALDPNNSESPYSLGNIYKKRRDSVNSVNYFIRSINNADKDFSQKKLLYMNKFVGNYYRVNAKFDSALVFYDRVQLFTPQNSSVYINRAVCYFGLDSLSRFCAELEHAYILGGAVNCYVLGAYCSGCSHLSAESGRTDSLLTPLDARLRGVLKNIVREDIDLALPKKEPIKSYKKRVYFNKLWQVCLPENANYYRESYWSKVLNFFCAGYTDYYIDGSVYATGTTNRTKPEGQYKCYWQNGNLKTEGQFIEGVPSGTWIYYLENGAVNFKVKLYFDKFEFQFVNKQNPNYSVNSGTGKFTVVLDRWNEIAFEIKGEYSDKKRIGKWTYSQAGQVIISEIYKKGKLKRGYFISAAGKMKIFSSKLDASILVPPQITQVRKLYFESAATLTEYPFIKVYTTTTTTVRLKL